MRKPVYRPLLDSLEPLALLSVTPAALYVPPNTPVTSATAHSITLTESMKGSYRAKEIPDAGKTYTFSGAGKLSSIGETSVAGTVHLPGLLISPSANPSAPQAQGQLILSNRHGRLTLALTAPSTDNASALPPYFNFTIQTGTGSYAHDSGSGYATIEVTPSSTRLAPGGLEHGHFTVSFSTAPPPVPGPVLT